MPASAKEFGRAILDRREALGLTQIEAAQRLGVTTRTLQRYESGESAPERDDRRARLLARLDNPAGLPVRKQARPGRPPTTPTPPDKDDIMEDEVVSITGGG